MKSLTKYTSVWSTRLLEITQSCSPLDRGALLSSRADVDTFGQWLFFSRENQNLSREKTQNFAREKKNVPVKNGKNCREIFFLKIYPKRNKNCEKQKYPVKKNLIFARESDFLPLKKPWNTIKLPVKKKVGRGKSYKKAKKCPWKKLTKWPKMAFTGNFLFNGKKKTLTFGAVCCVYFKIVSMFLVAEI